MDAEALKGELEKPGRSQVGLAKMLGVDQSAVNRMVNGKREIKARELPVIEAYLNATSRGQGRSRPRSDDVPLSDVRDDLPPMIAVPEYDVRLSAGPGSFNDQERIIDHWQFSRRYIENELRVAPASLGVVTVDGDSMYPTLWPGDRVMVDMTETNPAKPGIYALFDSDATVVKRVERVPASDPPEVVLISDNKNHNQYRVAADMVRVIGRVVWFARRM